MDSTAIKHLPEGLWGPAHETANREARTHGIIGGVLVAGSIVFLTYLAYYILRRSSVTIRDQELVALLIGTPLLLLGAKMLRHSRRMDGHYLTAALREPGAEVAYFYGRFGTSTILSIITNHGEMFGIRIGAGGSPSSQPAEEQERIQARMRCAKEAWPSAKNEKPTQRQS